MKIEYVKVLKILVKKRDFLLSRLFLTASSDQEYSPEIVSFQTLGGKKWVPPPYSQTGWSKRVEP